ncbi:MAG: hypothetical protein U0234_08380 [Sandaracinus sp.]
MGISSYARAGRATGFAVALVLGLTGAAGCGGGDEEASSSASAHSSSSSSSSASTSSSFTPGPAPATYGGGDSFVGGGGGGGGGGGAPHLGGVGGYLHDQEARRRAAIERAHRPPGPVRLTGLDEQQQRAADWAAATTSAHPVTSPDDDQCERMWAEHVATTEAYHAARHDGLHSAISASDERHFLRTCRSESPAQRQCLDRAYVQEHQDECEAAQRSDPQRQAAERAAHAAREPVEF